MLTQMLHLFCQLPAGYFWNLNADYARLHGVAVRDKALGIPSIKLQKEVANYKKSFIGLGKNDGRDSFIVADYVRVGRVAINPCRGAQYLALQRLTRQRRHVSESIAREKNYVLNNIFLKFSQFALLSGADSPVSDKFGATAEAILTGYMTTEDIVNAPLEQLAAFVADAGHGRFADPDQVAGLLKKAVRDSYRLDKSLYEPITTSIACSFDCIRAFEKEQKVLDQAIARTVTGLNPTEYQILKSIPGIGSVYAAGILAEMGSVRCFASNNSLAKYSGIVWRTTSPANLTLTTRRWSRPETGIYATT